MIRLPIWQTYCTFANRWSFRLFNGFYKQLGMQLIWQHVESGSSLTLQPWLHVNPCNGRLCCCCCDDIWRNRANWLAVVLCQMSTLTVSDLDKARACTHTHPLWLINAHQRQGDNSPHQKSQAILMRNLTILCFVLMTQWLKLSLATTLAF